MAALIAGCESSHGTVLPRQGSNWQLLHPSRPTPEPSGQMHASMVHMLSHPVVVVLVLVVGVGFSVTMAVEVALVVVGSSVVLDVVVLVVVRSSAAVLVVAVDVEVAVSCGAVIPSTSTAASKTSQYPTSVPSIIVHCAFLPVQGSTSHNTISSPGWHL